MDNFTEYYNNEKFNCIQEYNLNLEYLSNNIISFISPKYKIKITFNPISYEIECCFSDLEEKIKVPLKEVVNYLGENVLASYKIADTSRFEDGMDYVSSIICSTLDKLSRFDLDILNEMFKNCEVANETKLQEYFNNIIKPKMQIVPGGGYISSPFGKRNTGIPGASSDHKGIDIAGKPRQDILSFDNGVVSLVSVGTSSRRGNYIIIEHEDVNGKKYSTLYQHLHIISAAVGDRVERGDVIGIQGGGPNDNNPGTNGGSHLHFEIWDKNNYPIDPQPYLPKDIFKNENDYWNSFK